MSQWVNWYRAVEVNFHQKGRFRKLRSNTRKMLQLTYSNVECKQLAGCVRPQTTMEDGE